MRVIVGISGGVDSAVAALLLLRAGHDVAGLFMKNWEDDDTEGHCPAQADYEAARAACAVLEIPLFATNLSRVYREQVFSQFLDGYRLGETPNPDVLCNREIKFEAFWERARALGAERMATGHYARIIESEHGLLLGRSQDPDKDQTYFLSQVRHTQLQRALFPLAAHTKPEIRALAHAAGLPNHNRPDSTGICFIGERQFRPFLKRYLAPQPGLICSVDGVQRGEHQGLMYYTLGQRAGLGIGGPGGPWYVADKVPAHNLLVVSTSDDPALYSRQLRARSVEWRPAAPVLPRHCRAQIRHRQPDQACLVEGDAEGVTVTFDNPQRAAAAGQTIAFYENGICFGGGTISGRIDPPVYPWLALWRQGLHEARVGL